jgi:hypothetical protein
MFIDGFDRFFHILSVADQFPIGVSRFMRLLERCYRFFRRSADRAPSEALPEALGTFISFGDRASRVILCFLPLLATYHTQFHTESRKIVPSNAISTKARV